MSYEVLARKWRPQVFEEVIGQEHITQTLMNAIKKDRLAHAYLFSGARGVGKTSVARILAKAINCDEGQPGVPCNRCHSCVEITNGSSVDVQEIDGASNRGIDEIRELRENIKYMPASTAFRIYIIDEVHMLTLPAFNALLKTLEEPPAHVKFVFATTEPHKVPVTILSRCQRFDFKRISLGGILKQLEKISMEEGIEISRAALSLIAREAEGSMRDAESLLDQVVSFTGSKVEDRHISDILGIIDRELIFEASQAILEGSAEKCMDIVDRIYTYGYDIKEFYRVLMDQFRNLLVSLVAPQNDLIDLTDRDREEIDRQARMGGLEKIQQALNLLIVREPDLKMTSHPRLVLEAIMIKLCRLGDVLSFDELLKKIHILEKKLAAFPNKSGSAANLSDPGLDWEVEERAGPGSEMSTEEPEEQNWGDLLDHLASKNGAMANVLKEWRFLRLKGQTLEIARGDNPFSSSYLDEPERLDKFIDYCREYFSRDLIIKIVDDKKKDERIDAPDREETHYKQKEHSDLPQPVQDILQIFQGEIKEEISIKQEDTKESG
ncbi:MAG: DNA polymerase III subunit gamma/tau [Desulfobacteraceae bacterium]|jgi:DNA polymerase-3 subunit gamma/tau